MILLDTNIASVLMIDDHPDLPVISAWRDASPDQDIRVCSVTLAEIAYGIAILPDGAKKTRLRAAADRLFAATAAITLPFGNPEALAYGTILAARRAAGRPMSPFDAQIAATARVAGAAVATRNTADFEGTGVRLTNPYTHRG